MEIVINKGDGEDGENGDNGGDAQTRGLHYLNGTGEKPGGYSGRELEEEGGVEARVRVVEQGHHASLDGEQATTERQANAVTLALGGKERDENGGARIGRNHFAVIADVEQDFAFLSTFTFHSHGFGTGLNGILDQVDENLSQEVGVGIDSDTIGHIAVPRHFLEQFLDLTDHGSQIHLLGDRFLQSGILAVSVHKRIKVHHRVVNGVDTLF